MRRPRILFAVLSAMRSGSNNLQDALSEHPEIHCAGEIFNPSHVQLGDRLYLEERARGQVRGGAARVLFALARQTKRRFPRAVLRMARGPDKPVFGFRLFGDHIAYFELDPFLDELRAGGARFVHLLRRDTFAQAVSLVRAQTTGVWKLPGGAAAPAEPFDVLAAAERIGAAARALHAHKLTAARTARRCEALLVTYEDDVVGGRSYDRIQTFLDVRRRVVLRDANAKLPAADADACQELREDLVRRGVPVWFDPEHA